MLAFLLLVQAAYSKDVSMATLLLDYGADINLQGADGGTPLIQVNTFLLVLVFRHTEWVRFGPL